MTSVPISAPTVEQLLTAAWDRLAPGHLATPFPRGFWPDIARLAVELALFGEDHQPDWQPTHAGSRPARPPSPTRRRTPTRGKSSLTPEQRAANTAALLAALTSKGAS